MKIYEIISEAGGAIGSSFGGDPEIDEPEIDEPGIGGLDDDAFDDIDPNDPNTPPGENDQEPKKPSTRAPNYTKHSFPIFDGSSWLDYLKWDPVDRRVYIQITARCGRGWKTYYYSVLQMPRRTFYRWHQRKSKGKYWHRNIKGNYVHNRISKQEFLSVTD